MSKNKILRDLCRRYLERLKYLAEKRGLKSWIDDAIVSTNSSECKPTEHEVNMLARLVNDERVRRKDIPAIIGKTKRQCEADGDFHKIKMLADVGRYSKVSALLHANKQKRKKY